MADYYSITLRDESLETSNMRLRIVPIIEAEFDDRVTEVAALKAAIDGLTLGTVAKEQIEVGVLASSTAPSDVNAQRERKWLCYYSDDVTSEEFQFEMPTADLANGHKIAFQDNANLTDAEWTAFITAFEAVVLSPRGNAVTFRRAVHVGRGI